MTRYAVITGTGDLEEIRAYLPSNYAAGMYRHGVVIAGEDVAYSTLDYVIDRLASDLYWAQEQDINDLTFQIYRNGSYLVTVADGQHNHSVAYHAALRGEF